MQNSNCLMISSSVLIIPYSCNYSGKQRDVVALSLKKAPIPQLLYFCCHTPLVVQAAHHLHRQLPAPGTSFRAVCRAPKLMDQTGTKMRFCDRDNTFGKRLVCR